MSQEGSLRRSRRREKEKEAEGVALLEQEVAVREASSPCRDGLGGGAQARRGFPRPCVCLSVSWAIARSSPPFFSLFAPSSSVYGSPLGAQHCHRRGETAESETPVFLYSSRGGFFSLAPLGTSRPSSLPAVPCSVLITIPGLHPPDASSLPRPRCDNQKCLQPFPSVPPFQNR